MLRLLAVSTAAAMAMAASAAMADEVSGAVENINLTDNTFQVGDKMFTASPENTVGAKLADLMEGDQVTVVFDDAGESGDAINAMELKKAE